MNAPSIFIVEDEIITAKSIAKNIVKFGYTLAGIATSGSQAIQDILATKPNLILMDIMLDRSDIDGIAAAQQVQSQLNVPVIYLTAHSDRETLERAKITTPFGYILKPYSKKNLQINIELALHKHQQEMQLAKREELLSEVLDAADDGVIVADKSDRIVYMNSAAEELTGWQATEANNRQTKEVLRIVDRRTQQSLEPIKEILDRKEAIYLSESAILLTRNDGQTSIANSSSSILQKDGDITGAVLIFAPQKNAGGRKKSSQSQFLTAIGSNQKLNRFGNYLVDIIVHELRTPLTVILSTTESLQNYRQKWTPEKQNKSFKRIQKAIEHISRLLEDISIWEELEKRQFVLQPSWTDVLSSSQQILEELELIDEANHQLVVSFQGDRRSVYLDPYVLRYILTNLLHNAIKYSPKKSTVSLLIQYESNRLILKVQNQGIGIPTAEREQIFKPLYRGSNTDRIKGTGLGLAIVKEYVRLSGGEINLENNSPSTTIFTVCLPLIEPNLEK